MPAALIKTMRRMRARPGAVSIRDSERFEPIRSAGRSPWIRHELGEALRLAPRRLLEEPVVRSARRNRMTLRTAQVVIVIEALVIGVLVIALLAADRGGLAAHGSPEGRAERSDRADDHDGTGGYRAPTERSASRQRPESKLSSIAPRPFVEADDVAWTPDDPVGIVLFGKLTTPDGEPPKD